MKHYLETADKVFEEVKSTETGLTSQEAEQRLERDGKNKLAEGKKVIFENDISANADYEKFIEIDENGEVSVK